MSEETVTEEKGKKLEDIRKEAEKKSCSVQKALYFIDEFLSELMCGRCFPCSLGTQEAKIRLIRISQLVGNASTSDINALKRIGIQMTGGSFCKKGKDTGRFITEILTNSEDEFNQHISGTCPKKECVTFTEYVINPDLCILCGKCLEACKYNAIVGEKKKHHTPASPHFEIIQGKCTRCGECIKVCPTEAIDVIFTEIEELVPSNQ